MQIIPLLNIPLVQPGNDLADLILTATAEIDLTLTDQDIIVVAQKIVSKAEGQFVPLAEVTPSARALELAEITGKPAQLIEVILWDTAEVIRAVPQLLIVEHKLGFISANAGIDHSNVSAEPDVLLRLPADPDASARTLRQQIAARSGAKPPVLIIDSHGRPWRFGTVGVTIGLSGLAPVQDLRGTSDLFGVPLAYTDVGFTDQIAAAASLVMGQAAEGCPVVVVRGLPFEIDEVAKAADVLRPKKGDLFR
ncbi:MAG TPA: coenzyme F420-0:L-glutamate ligase [Anaerolineae bacterium]|nr:coenzyme F420-0:L-glutamate ligase [Anaerolineae bacterium]